MQAQPKCHSRPASAARVNVDWTDPIPGTAEEKRVVAAALLAEANAQEIEDELKAMEQQTYLDGE